MTCEVTPAPPAPDRRGSRHVGILDPHEDEPAPARSRRTSTAIVAGILDGTIDAIATDHAPHHADEKAVDFNSAPFGIVGLETAVSLIHDRFVARGRFGLDRFVTLFSAGPARVFGLPGGTLAPGAPADVTLFDPEARVKVDPHKFLSKGRSTPFAGWELFGAPAATIVGGDVVWQRVEI